MKAKGKYVVLKLLETVLEKQTKSFGLVLPELSDLEQETFGSHAIGKQVRHRIGSVLSMGDKATKVMWDVANGDQVLFNPYDATPLDKTHFIVDAAGILAKVI